MSLQLKAYLCVVTEGYNNSILTANSYPDLVKQIINDIIDNKGEDYPDITKFLIPNSMDFIADYDEEEHRGVLNEMVCYLASKGCEYTTKLLEIDQEISEENLVTITHDII